jgi:hypothetical protein
MNVFMRGDDNEKRIPRGARLVEEIYDTAIKAEKISDRIAAAKLIFDRIDGKAVERKEIRSIKIEGIVEIPAAVDIKEIDINEMGTERETGYRAHLKT